MTLSEELELSYYEDLEITGPGRNVSYVRDRRTGRILLKKKRTIYDKEVYNWIMEHPVEGIPKILLMAETDRRDYEWNAETVVQTDSHTESTLILIEELIDGVTLESLLRSRVAGTGSPDREVAGYDETCRAGYHDTYGTKNDETHGVAHRLHHHTALVTEKEIHTWMRQLLDLMLYFHHADPPIVHRDLKPENLIISNTGRLYLVDCNTARCYEGNAERDTRLLGTAGYAAPEQYGFGESDQRTDIYAFGMILNYLLTGKLSRQHIRKGKWEPLIKKCLELEPARRYTNAEELQKAFNHLAGPCKKTDHSAESKHPAADNLFPDGRGDFRLPGFRGAPRPVKIIAAILYIFFAIICISLIADQVQYGFKHIIGEGIMAILAMIFPILFLTDYHGFQHLFPGARSRRKPIRILALAGWSIALFILCALISGLIFRS